MPAQPGWIGVVETGMGWAGAPVQDGKAVIDLDATLVTAHSDKESATRT